MTQPGPAAQPEYALDRLLAETHLRIKQQQYAEAKERLEQAKALAPREPAVLELEGDLLFAQRRYAQAEAIYLQAFHADPSNARVEEKYATAIVKVHEPQLRAEVMSLPDDSPWDFRIARPPWASALFSALFPGLGQFYNGDLLKGAGIVFLNIIFWSRMANVLYYLVRDEGQRSREGVMGSLTQGANIFVLLLMLALWIYSIVDAYLIAREENGGY